MSSTPEMSQADSATTINVPTEVVMDKVKETPSTLKSMFTFSTADYHTALAEFFGTAFFLFLSMTAVQSAITVSL